MEPKKDNIIQKITTERGFADEIFKKYRFDRYGIGSCCGSNLPSYIKDKYLCDYQDNKISQYDNIEVVKTAYVPPEGGASEDPKRPAWVDQYCGDVQGDVDIYFYYDATSLGLGAVMNAYNASTEWVGIIRSGNLDAPSGSCAGGEAVGINEYHTTIFGERWLDWATSAMTGTYQNAGSCGGNGTPMANGNPCTTGQPVDADPNPLRNFGINDCGSVADSAFPETVQSNSKFWSILNWAQANGVTMHNAGIPGATVANSCITDNSGGIFSSVVTIGPPPPATNKNLLVVVFADESTSSTHKQPYHDLGPTVSWNTATDGTGSMTPCWGADHAEFIAQRAVWMNAQPGRQSDFFLYPSNPVGGPGNGQLPFPLHSLGAVSSGDKPSALASATITFTGNPVDGEFLTIQSTAFPGLGLTLTYFADAATDLNTRKFNSSGTPSDIATELKACIEYMQPYGHGGDITVTQNGGTLTLTQITDTSHGDTTIITDLTNATVPAAFSGGFPDGMFNTIPFCSIASMNPIGTSNPYFAQKSGALDQHGWGVDPAMLSFQSSTFQEDLTEFTNLTTCNDSECFLFVVKNQNGDPVEGHPIIMQGGIIGYTDENGLLRWCVEDASVNTHHVLDLCTCLSTTGGCASQKVSITLTDSSLTSCPTTPFQACDPDAEGQSSGNENEGCTDPAADNYDPNAGVDNGSCTYCQSFTIAEISRTDATETGGVCNDDGAIDITVNGGTAPYTYYWTGPGGFTATTQDISGLCGGQYTVMVTDSSTPSPCVETEIFLINQPATIIYGCTNTEACNYDATATQDDGSCLFDGCTDISATNYDASATADCNCNGVGTAQYQNLVGWDSCCTGCVDGCMDPLANNYDASATCDDGSCTYNWNCIETTTTGGSEQQISCPTQTYVGTFGTALQTYAEAQRVFLDYIADSVNGLDNTDIPSMKWSSICLAPTGTNGCTDDVANNGGTMHIVTSIEMGYFSNNDGTCGCTNGVNCWPSGWTWTPNYNGFIHRHTGTWLEWVALLNSTISDGQTWVDQSGAGVATFTGLSYTEITAILSASQGSCASQNVAPLTNLLFPECCGIVNFANENAEGIGYCSCELGTITECNCTEMTDGTGIYPTEDDCLNAAESCCNNPGPDNYTCIPGTFTNNCSNKTEANPGTSLMYSMDINIAIAEQWTLTFSSNTNPIDYYWNVMTGGSNLSPGGCYDPSTGISLYYLKSITFERDGVLVVEIDDAVAPVDSWGSFLGDLAITYGYDGTTYPSVAGMTYTQVVVQLATSEPGIWSSLPIISICNCNQSGNCDCISDPNGLYTDYNTCFNDCCPLLLFGCTDPSAFNFSSTANADNGSCLYCEQGSYNLTPAGDVTITTTDPTSNGATDGSITITFNSINAYYTPTGGATTPAGGTVITLYDATTGNQIGVTWIPGGGINPASYSVMTFDNPDYQIGYGTYIITIEEVHVYNGITYVVCNDTFTVNDLAGSGTSLWECQPGTFLDESLVTPGVTLDSVLQNTTGVYVNVAQLNAGNTNGLGYYASYSDAIDDWNWSSIYQNPIGWTWPWWYQVTATAPTTTGDVQCQSDGTNAYKTSFLKIEYKNTNTGVVMYTCDVNTPWPDLVTFVDGNIGSTSAPNVKFSILRAAIIANDPNEDLVVDLKAVICDSNGCDCVQSPTGTYANAGACNQDCCINGCTDPAADNYDANAVWDDGNCLYCSTFSNIVTITDPTSPPGATSWNAGNINVNNGAINATGIGGSGNYSYTVAFAGYNSNQFVNPNALWPGFYEVVVTDDTLGCTVTTYHQLNPLYTKCHDNGNPWLPNSQSQWMSTGGVYNYLVIDNAPNGNTTSNVYASNGDTINIANLLGTYLSIEIYDSSGTQVAVATSISSFSWVGATPGDTYYIEITQATNCANVGVIFTMPV